MSNKKQPTKNPQKPPNKALAYFGKHMISTILLLMIVIGVYSAIVGNHKEKTVVAFSQFASFVTDGSIASIAVDGNKITAKKVDGTEIVTTKETENALSEALITYGVPKEKLITVPITVDSGSGASFWLMLVLPILGPVIVIGLIMFYMARQMKGANGQAMSFGNSRARLTDPNDKNNKVTFADVAGAREAKEELVEIVDFLRNPKKFLDIGAQIPKGVLLTGAPGTGKTLLARAVAGEAGVPFFHLSGSEFVEMFVGVGASRVRDLFKMAKKASPAIVFIDEIDAVGRVRGHGTGGGNDEREQTLNQILVEMDGFEPTEKVIVMAATNRSDVLDPALLRPGRFDRRVTIDLPDRRDREEILQIHARKKPFAEDVDLKLIAERTPGFSGADLYSLMNEGAILAARENRTTVVQNDLFRSIEKVMIGPERKSHLFTQKEKKITAYHEAGHALVSSILPDADPVHKVSIIARGRAGGYTLKLPLEERKLQSKKEFLDDIAMSLGGYVAEEMIMGDITTGPSNDLQVATNLARAMVTRWGMSDAIGPVALESDGGRALFGAGVGDKEYSENMSMKIDAEVSKIMNDGLARAREVLTKHRNILDAIAEKLMEVETLEQPEYEEILKKYSIPLKKMVG
ncbi:MAG: ATP-dependent zinc metalloprotease FtsH [bacterium]